MDGCGFHTRLSLSFTYSLVPRYTKLRGEIEGEPLGNKASNKQLAGIQVHCKIVSDTYAEIEDKDAEKYAKNDFLKVCE